MTAIDIWRGDRPSSMLSSLEPFSNDFDRIFRDMERLITPVRSLAGSNGDFLPSVDIDESENAYHLMMDIPGVDKDNIHIEVVGNSVKVSGERNQEKEEEGVNRYRYERRYGKFARSFTLPQGVKEDDIEANYDNGVLCVTIPKAENNKTKHIPVKMGKPGLLNRLTGKSKEKSEKHS